MRSIRVDELEELWTSALPARWGPSDTGAPLPEAVDVCMLKADVEGYEPQVIKSAERLLRTGRVRAVQLELSKPGTHGARARSQREASVQMLRHLTKLGFELRQVPNHIIDSNVTLPTPGHTWRESPGPWETLPRFPSQEALRETRERMARSRRLARRRASRDPVSVVHAALPHAYARDVLQQSTNLIGRHINSHPRLP